MKHVTDGTSNTFLIGERNAELLRWGGSAFGTNFPAAYSNQKPNSPTSTKNPVDWDKNGGFSSHHVGGVQMLLTDGSVTFISNNIDFPTWCYLGDKSDGKVLGDF